MSYLWNLRFRKSLILRNDIYSLNLVEWNLTWKDRKFSLSRKKSENSRLLNKSGHIFTLFSRLAEFSVSSSEISFHEI